MDNSMLVQSGDKDEHMDDNEINDMTNMYVGSPTSTLDGDKEPQSPNVMDINDMEESHR
jgi:hypothetical protein